MAGLFKKEGKGSSKVNSNVAEISTTESKTASGTINPRGEKLENEEVNSGASITSNTFQPQLKEKQLSKGKLTNSFLSLFSLSKSPENANLDHEYKGEHHANDNSLKQNPDSPFSPSKYPVSPSIAPPQTQDIPPVSVPKWTVLHEKISRSDTRETSAQNKTNSQANTVISPHSHRITDLCFTNNSTFLYSTSHDGTLSMYCVPKKMTMRNIKISPFPLSSCCLPFDNENRQLVVAGSWDNSVYIYNSASEREREKKNECIATVIYINNIGRVLQKLTGHQDSVSSLSTSSLSLCSGSWDSSIKLWAWKTDGLCETPVASYSSHTAEIRCTVSSFSSPYLFGCGDESGNIFLYDSRAKDSHSNNKNSHVRSILGAHKKEITHLCWIPNKFEFVSISVDGYIKLWDGASSKPVSQHNAGEHLNCVTSDGNYAITGGESGAVGLYTIDQSSKICKLLESNHLFSNGINPHGVAITTIKMNLDGGCLAIGTKEFRDNIILCDLFQPK
ncbi:WD-40 repeat protein [Reticulomyxa filosa]|uniref:WD-40 repeat protein n=1 Tax=Reticulomyxa filosa TaxID=46433 RepID=X6N3A4_RETFI|nr:WD-40 repeat protein [Reticulomyxa filosa]|eukprot:ETO20546.1 WD-40 repeat protein [Reticulomyxa filosa]